MRYVKHKFPKFLFEIIDFDSETVEKVNIGLSLQSLLLFSLKTNETRSGQYSRWRLLRLKATRELKGNTFVWNHTVRFLCIVIFPGQVKDYSLPKLLLSVRVFV